MNPPNDTILRHQSDEDFMRDCRWDVFRGPGPGGQKRNKTSSAVRLTHEPTGISVIAGESRSQAENRMRAVRRLRLKIACDVRKPIDPRGFEPPDWIEKVRGVPE